MKKIQGLNHWPVTINLIIRILSKLNLWTTSQYIATHVNGYVIDDTERVENLRDKLFSLFQG